MTGIVELEGIRMPTHEGSHSPIVSDATRPTLSGHNVASPTLSKDIPSSRWASFKEAPSKSLSKAFETLGENFIKEARPSQQETPSPVSTNAVSTNAVASPLTPASPLENTTAHPATTPPQKEPPVATHAQVASIQHPPTVDTENTSASVVKETTTQRVYPTTEPTITTTPTAASQQPTRVNPEMPSVPLADETMRAPSPIANPILTITTPPSVAPQQPTSIDTEKTVVPVVKETTTQEVYPTTKPTVDTEKTVVPVVKETTTQKVYPTTEPTVDTEKTSASVVKETTTQEVYPTTKPTVDTEKTSASVVKETTTQRVYPTTEPTITTTPTVTPQQPARVNPEMPSVPLADETKRVPSPIANPTLTITTPPSVAPQQSTSIDNARPSLPLTDVPQPTPVIIEGNIEGKAPLAQPSQHATMNRENETPILPLNETRPTVEQDDGTRVDVSNVEPKTTTTQMPMMGVIAPTPTLEASVAPLVEKQTTPSPQVKMMVAAAEAVTKTIAVSPTLATTGEGEIHIQLKQDVLDGSTIRLEAKGGDLKIIITPASRAAEETFIKHQEAFQMHLAERVTNWRINVGVTQWSARAVGNHRLEEEV